MSETTDEKNATELEHGDGRADPARDGEQASEERTTGGTDYKPKTSNVYGRANYGDFYPADETVKVESAPAPRPTSAARTPGLRCDDPDSLCDTEGHEFSE